MHARTGDEVFMREALFLAEIGRFRASPNPMVGAVIVKGGKKIARGWHNAYGQEHAEIAVLHDAAYRKKEVEGATLYVNLEPCVMYDGKKTPACAPEIVRAGISRVVIAMKDPNPRVAGRGIKFLKKAGLRVKVGCLRDEAEELNKKFVKWMKTGMPFVGMKVAMSLDGKIATRTGDSKWITSDESRKFVRQLRDSYDAILVGSGTVLADNPELKGALREPLRVILDSRGRCPKNARVFRDANFFLVRKKTSLTRLLHELGRKNISSVLIEGGAEIFGSFVDARLVDRFHWFIAPKIIGGATAKTAVSGLGASTLKNALILENPTVRRVGPDFYFETTSALGASSSW